MSFALLAAEMKTSEEDFKYAPVTKRETLIEAILTTPKRVDILQKGGDPTAGSPTVTLLRLHPSYQSLFRRLPPKGLAHRLLEQLTPMV